jgi:hypothetical protein
MEIKILATVVFMKGLIFLRRVEQAPSQQIMDALILLRRFKQVSNLITTMIISTSNLTLLIVTEVESIIMPLISTSIKNQILDRI